MQPHISTLTQKGQVTIPVEIRHELDLHPGDKLYFELVEGNVILKKASSFDFAYHHALETQLSEWNSPADNDAYNDL